ncbi:MAG: 3-methyl-2-oxobutanoate hydroxymethyltransferase [candidate division KSB1 bacterium]|jgi:3-methyl-2-oxobutanoate hydroxymethyltransferase|nr:3-methyl-2-oxobutanoate hydroxymethyltransferase [candidate division KSB1 bacterium]
MNKIKKVSLLDIEKKYKDRKSITMMTAYDYPGAIQVDESGVDIILVGDSLAMTVLGHPTTVSVTMEEMLHHCKAVSRGAQRAFLVGDMPFLSYQADPAEAVRNAGRFLKEANMDAVKLEGGRNVLSSIQAILNVGIPVMGHLGLTPQTATKLGGYRVQGKIVANAVRLLEDALALQEAGCFAIVLEAITAPVAKVITERLDIPTIGIGSGVDCGGQVLVYHDILGLYDQFVPKFVKQYANLQDTIIDAIREYREDVEQRTFPTDSHAFDMDDDEYERFLKAI